MKNLNNKLIIRNYTELSDIEVLSYVISVVKEGRVSKTSKGPQYCFYTTFKDNIEVSVVKSGKDTETFYVFKEGDRLRYGEDS